MRICRSQSIHVPLSGIGLLASLLLIGCAGREPIEVPEAKVGPVTAYGMVVDENSAPQEVVYVLTRAIKDDVTSAQAHDQAGHKEAVDTQFKLAAYSVLQQRVLGAMNAHDGPEITTLDPDRAEKLYETVRQWGAIAAHYVPSFAEDLEEASRRMEVAKKTGGTAIVYYEVSHNPEAAEEEERQPATLKFELHREQSEGKAYWRVAMVDFKRPPAPDERAEAKPSPATLPVPTTQPSTR